MLNIQDQEKLTQAIKSVDSLIQHMNYIDELAQAKKLHDMSLVWSASKITLHATYMREVMENLEALMQEEIKNPYQPQPEPEDEDY